MSTATPPEGTEANFLGRAIAKDSTLPPVNPDFLVFCSSRRSRSVRYDARCPSWDPKKRFALSKELRQVLYEKLNHASRDQSGLPGRRKLPTVSSTKTSNGVSVSWSGLALDVSMELVVTMDRVYAQIMVHGGEPREQ